MQLAKTSIQIQRRQLWEVMEQLRAVRSQYMEYRSLAVSAYQGEEAVYILQAINQVNQQLYDLLQICYGLAEQFAWMERTHL